MARIAFVLPNMAGGGAERVALALIEGFVARGHEVELALMAVEGDLLPLVPPQVRLVDLKAQRIRDALLPLVRYFRERRPDAMQVSMWPLTIVAIAARILARSKARLVVSDHAILSKQYVASSLSIAALRHSVKFLYPRADARVCVSATVADDLASLSGLERSCFEVVHNPIAGPPTSGTPHHGIEGLWTGRARRILAVGALKREKNYPLLMRAFARLNARGQANLMIVGEGDLRPDLVRLASELGIADRVAMPGFALNPWAYYESAHVFALTSDEEGFGNVLVEAMAAGLPVVSTDCGSGPREILAHGRYGRLVPVGDAETLADSLEASLADPVKASSIKERARDFRPELAIERYSDLLGLEAN